MQTGQRVTHVDYPKIQGTITCITWGPPQLHQVVWDRPRPAFFGGHVRVSTHIWTSLRPV